MIFCSDSGCFDECRSAQCHGTHFSENYFERLFFLWANGVLLKQHNKVKLG